jgi:hypothetical protein
MFGFGVELGSEQDGEGREIEPRGSGLLSPATIKLTMPLPPVCELASGGEAPGVIPRGLRFQNRIEPI